MKLIGGFETAKASRLMTEEWACPGRALVELAPTPLQVCSSGGRVFQEARKVLVIGDKSVIKQSLFLHGLFYVGAGVTSLSFLSRVSYPSRQDF